MLPIPLPLGNKKIFVAREKHSLLKTKKLNNLIEIATGSLVGCYEGCRLGVIKGSLALWALGPSHFRLGG